MKTEIKGRPGRAYLDHPVVRYLIIGVFSVMAAVIFFTLGGSLAEVSGNQDTFLGFGFKASGAIGGFFIIFWISLKALDRLAAREDASKRINVRVFLVGVPEGFSRDASYVCHGRIFDTESGEKRKFSVEPRWHEVGYLAVDFRDVGPDDLVGARIESDGDKAWQLDDFVPVESKREAHLLKVARQKQTERG